MARVTIQATIPDSMIDSEGFVSEESWNQIEDALATIDDIMVEDILVEGGK